MPGKGFRHFCHIDILLLKSVGSNVTRGAQFERHRLDLADVCQITIHTVDELYTCCLQEGGVNFCGCCRGVIVRREWVRTF